ncbi:hypothetical protein RhiirA1_449870 [Rhizophagus irregularis]|uniref:DNA-directed DNA polymerase n=1 Tax=Rhizophagus irregularis TaxID=588596 RepID=A0A2N0SG51_9GLOM|nr:hypothetical protein RhiirA1_449870 [Rhizophagus irregularis]
MDTGKIWGHGPNATEEFVKRMDIEKRYFPYEYIDSHEKFKETSIPPIEKFLGVLKRKITQKDYKHAEKVLNEFKCKNLEEYHDLSENRTFTDMEMHDFAEKARRGGITMACRRYFRANNPKCKNFYMRSPKTWLSYVDANNLYGWAMSQYLPIGGYYVQLECHFPSQTHNYLQDLPPTVENIKTVHSVLVKRICWLCEEIAKRNEYIRTIAIMLFPNEDSYRKRIIRYREWYVNKIELLENVENLYNLYYELSKEEQITEEDIGNIRTGSKDLYNVLGQSWLTVHEAIINLCRSEISLYGMSIPFIDEEELYSDKDLYYEFRELLTKKYFRGGNDHKLHDSLSESSESSVSSVSSVICDIPRKNK